LISNAVSQFPRPGLFTFLEYCHQNLVGLASHFETRLVIFTAVNEVRFRSISRKLADANDVPDWFVDLEYINWTVSSDDRHETENDHHDRSRGL
jgi:hypothetical protein